jgi:hypothetical protein
MTAVTTVMSVLVGSPALGEPRHLAEGPGRDQEAFAVGEGLVVDADDEADDAVHDEHDAHRDDHEDHGRRLLLAVEAVDRAVGAQHEKRRRRDAEGQGEKRGGQGPDRDAGACRNQVIRIVTIAPKAIVSPWAKFEKRRMP